MAEYHVIVRISVVTWLIIWILCIRSQLYNNKGLMLKKNKGFKLNGPTCTVIMVTLLVLALFIDR
jgi:hypothetical protein